MIEYEYILKVGRKNIDIINKVTECYEGLGVIRTLDTVEGVVKLLTNQFFLDDVDKMLTKIKEEFDINIEIISKNIWQGEI